MDASSHGRSASVHAMRGRRPTAHSHRLRLAWINLLLCVLLGLFRAAFAGDAGEIVSVVGSVEVRREGRWQPLKPGEILAVGAVLKTAAGSRVALQLANGSQIKLNANCELELKKIAPRESVTPAANTPLQNILRVFKGEIWVRSNGVPLEVQSMPVVATIRGTEFNLAVGADQVARLAVLDGMVEFHNPQGSVMVAANEQATAKVGEAPHKTVLLDPLDAVQWSLYYPGLVSHRDYALSSGEAPPAKDRSQNRSAGSDQQAWTLLEAGDVGAALAEFRQARPPTLMSSVGTAEALYRLDRFAEADRAIDETQQRYPRAALPWVQAARSALIRGRVPEAQQALDQALARDPHSALAHGLRSNIFLVQNRKEQARDAAERAVAANSSSPTAYLNLSLVEQADFKLDAALAAARQAVALDPDNPQALIQESRLLFGMGRVKEALKVAEKARHRAPRDALVNSTWGFLQLARGRTHQAHRAFQEAIAQDSTLGEPHLGLGLALFRRNQTAAAIEEMRKATLLEPKVSLYNSYLGKAYFEIRDDRMARKYFAQAKQLDPRDPTPHFYEALRLQSVNRPVAAVQNLQKSIELNENRAVYRSKLLLDEDLATRDTSLARVYEDLGFDQLAQIEASKSLTLNPANYSAHRFLSDSYATRPRHEIARVSELLQAQLLQPLNINPVQPSLNETNLRMINGFDTSTLNEYTSLFERDRTQVLISGIAGNNTTLADEIVLSGLQGPISYSLGQFHYETEGFRANNDLKHDIFNLFTQVALTAHLNVQAEFRRRKTSMGDLSLKADGSYDNEFHSTTQQDIARLGAHFSPSFQSDFIVSAFYSDRDEGNNVTDKGYQTEAQHLFHTDQFNLTTGVGIYDIDHQGKGALTAKEQDAYFNINVAVPENIIWTLGLGYVSFKQSKEQFLDIDQLNPKFGLQWAITENVGLRLASFKTLKPRLIVQQTIAPTQIAGFNQFFDAPNGTTAESQGIGLDFRFADGLYGGLEGVQRDLQIPIFNASSGVFDFFDGREKAYLGYLYWTPHPHWAIRSEYRFDRFSAEGIVNLPFDLHLFGAYQVDTNRLPLIVRYFSPSGVFGEISLTYVYQKAKIDGVPFNETGELFVGSNKFILVDTAVGYRLPKRQGILSLEIKNLLDRNFHYEEISSQLSPEPGNPLSIPQRLIFAKFTLNF